MTVKPGYKLKDKQDRNDKILDYISRGFTVKAIAGIFHISPGRVSHIKKRARDKQIAKATRDIKSEEIITIGPSGIKRKEVK